MDPWCLGCGPEVACLKWYHLRHIGRRRAGEEESEDKKEGEDKEEEEEEDEDEEEQGEEGRGGGAVCPQRGATCKCSLLRLQVANSSCKGAEASHLGHRAARS